MQEQIEISSYTMTQDDRKLALPHFFDKNPELKKRVMEFLRQIPDAEKKNTFDAFRKFVSGDLTWAEVQHVPKRLLKELAKIGYLKFQMADYQGAEILFKGLAIIDHNNWYYRAALGAVYQKQGFYDSAIDEFTVALQIKEDEITSLVNRGECYMKIHDFDSALEDFTRATQAEVEENNPWKKRAVTLSKQIVGDKE